MELVDLEYVREPQGWVLRLFVDRPGGIGVDDLTSLSHAIGPLLDVENVVPHAYHLEVSSPGLNRPLKKPDHFRRAQGKKIRVKTYGPLGDPPRKNFLGVLSAVSADGVVVEVEGAGPFEISFAAIAKANLEFEL